jgi:ABC-type multidrug transport system ATPase subunit
VTVDAIAPSSRDTFAPADEADGLLVLQDIRKSWGKRPILEGLGLSVPRGALVSISGANGPGKTTLLRIAAGLIHPESGDVALDGLHPERHRRGYLARLGFLSAGDRSLYARLSGRRHLDFCARLALIPADRRGAAIAQAIDVFALNDFADRRADRLSMGQRQRVRLGMTFVHDPALVLLDEPMNSLDGEGLDVLAAYLERLCRRGGAAVWCSPEGVPASLAADNELRLADGRLQAV